MVPKAGSKRRNRKQEGAVTSLPVLDVIMPLGLYVYKETHICVDEALMQEDDSKIKAA